jgi:hypothetical protein
MICSLESPSDATKRRCPLPWYDMEEAGLLPGIIAPVAGEPATLKSMALFDYAGGWGRASWR